MPYPKISGKKYCSDLKLNCISELASFLGYNILIEIGTPTKLVRLIKMCLNKTYNGRNHRCL